ERRALVGGDVVVVSHGLPSLGTWTVLWTKLWTVWTKPLPTCGFLSVHRPGVPVDNGAPTGRVPGSDVEEADILGIALDERAPGVDVLAHQHAEQLVRGGRVVEGHLHERPSGRVHRGLPQLGEVHLAQALVALDVVGLGARVVLLAQRDQAVALAVGV